MTQLLFLTGLLSSMPAVPFSAVWPDAKEELTKAEQNLLEFTNRERKAAELPPLQGQEKLHRVARAHARNMARQGKLDHDLDGKSPADRITEAGYAFQSWGENICRGQPDPAAALRTWLNSPPHKANLLKADYLEIGVGVAVDAEGRRYYVQVFAAPFRR